MEKKRIDKLRDDLRAVYTRDTNARVDMKAFTVLELIAEIDRMRPIVERAQLSELSGAKSMPDIFNGIFK